MYFLTTYTYTYLLANTCIYQFYQTWCWREPGLDIAGPTAVSCRALYLPPGIITSTRLLLMYFQALHHPVPRWPKQASKTREHQARVSARWSRFSYSRKASGQAGRPSGARQLSNPAPPVGPHTRQSPRTTCPTAPRSPYHQPTGTRPLATISGCHSSSLPLSTAQAGPVTPQRLCRPAR